MQSFVGKLTHACPVYYCSRSARPRALPAGLSMGASCSSGTPPEQIFDHIRGGGGGGGGSGSSDGGGEDGHGGGRGGGMRKRREAEGGRRHEATAKRARRTTETTGDHGEGGERRSGEG